MHGPGEPPTRLLDRNTIREAHKTVEEMARLPASSDFILQRGQRLVRETHIAKCGQCEKHDHYYINDISNWNYRGRSYNDFRQENISRDVSTHGLTCRLYRACPPPSRNLRPLPTHFVVNRRQPVLRNANEQGGFSHDRAGAAAGDTAILCPQACAIR